MHTATSLKESLFTIEIDGQEAGFDALLPDWHPHDRIGFVIHEGYGWVGASQLLQAAITAFYDVSPTRRNGFKQCPEIYAFPVGRPHGDTSVFDVYPARKEVLVENDPESVLGAINDRAITRLLVPDGTAGSTDIDWAEMGHARERIVSAFAYSPTGAVRDPDITITGTVATEWNATMTLNPLQYDEFFMTASPQELHDFEPQIFDDDVDTDALVAEYHQYVVDRATEVSEDHRQALIAQRTALLQEGRATEQYRRIDLDEALGLLTTS